MKFKNNQSQAANQAFPNKKPAAAPANQIAALLCFRVLYKNLTTTLAPAPVDGAS